MIWVSDATRSLIGCGEEKKTTTPPADKAKADKDKDKAK